MGVWQAERHHDDAVLPRGQLPSFPHAGPGACRGLGLERGGTRSHSLQGVTFRWETWPDAAWGKAAEDETLGPPPAPSPLPGSRAPPGLRKPESKESCFCRMDRSAPRAESRVGGVERGRAGGFGGGCRSRGLVGTGIQLRGGLRMRPKSQREQGTEPVRYFDFLARSWVRAKGLGRRALFCRRDEGWGGGERADGVGEHGRRAGGGESGRGGRGPAVGLCDSSLPSPPKGSDSEKQHVHNPGGKKP